LAVRFKRMSDYLVSADRKDATYISYCKNNVGGQARKNFSMSVLQFSGSSIAPSFGNSSFTKNEVLADCSAKKMGLEKAAMGKAQVRKTPVQPRQAVIVP
jgi:hypothetical protein